MRYIPIKPDAEEAMNNAFLRIYKHISQFKNEGSFEGWMKRIVVNSCLAFIRTASYERHSKIITLHNSYNNEEVLQTNEDSFFSKNEMEEKFDKEYLYSLLISIPETPRLVFNLYVFEDYTHKEIGLLLNIAERTSQAHLATARKLLAAEIDKKKLIHKIQRV